MTAYASAHMPTGYRRTCSKCGHLKPVTGGTIRNKKFRCKECSK